LKVPPDPVHVAHSVGLVLASMPGLERVGVRTLLFGLEFCAYFLAGSRFSRLEPGPRDALVVRLAESPRSAIRLVARLLLTVVKPAHFSRRVVQQAVGYPADRLDDVEPVQEVQLPLEQVFERLGTDKEIRCQVVVVGSGAGGAVVAAELAERGIDVVIIEAGHRVDASSLGRDPAAVLRSLYLDGATTMAFGTPSIPLPLGRSVGGTTTINSGTCFRPPDRVLDAWVAQGLHLDRAHLADCFERVETRLNVQPVPAHLLGGSSAVVARGAEALGLEHGPLQRNIRGCQQSAVCPFGCPRNAKQSTNISYVPWALEAGARLYPGVRATRLLKEGSRAAGLECQTDTGHRLTVHADVVVSACGAISGVSFLHNVGLRNKNLGRHLTIHPGVKIVAQMPELVNGWEDTPQGYGLSGFQQEGLMFEGAFVPPEYTAIALPFVGRAFTEVMEAYPHLAMFGFMVADEAVGRVWPVPGRSPFIRYSLHPDDKARVQRGLDVLAELFFAAGAERIFLPIAGREEQATLAAARAAIGAELDPMALEMAAFHPLGTARMAASARAGVVDSDLETWEVGGLYVVDGSVVPSALGVNPQITIMGLATRAAETIAARLGPQMTRH
jgi:choline dehydrogenase-like flavoprotein